MKHAKLGLIGYQAPGFQDFHPNPFVMRKTFGTLLLQIGITEYANLAKGISREYQSKLNIKPRPLAARALVLLFAVCSGRGVL